MMNERPRGASFLRGRPVSSSSSSLRCLVSRPTTGTYGPARRIRRHSSSSSNWISDSVLTTLCRYIDYFLTGPKAVRQERIVASLQQFQLEHRDWTTATETTKDRLSPETEFSINPYELDRHGRGESHHRGFVDIGEEENEHEHDHDGEAVTPDVIVRPATVDDVSTILRYCNDEDNTIAVIPYGAGTSVEGHVCATRTTGTISLDMNKFQQITLPAELFHNQQDTTTTTHNTTTTTSTTGLLPDPIAIVGAGVTRTQLNDALRHTGMTFTVDPGADATISGMVATGASGTTSVKYGTIRDNILDVSCVLPDGTVIDNVGTKASKSSAGYDLLGLMCGSEGTLGVITSVTVKLHPVPNHIVAAVCVFPTLSEAIQSVAMLKYYDVGLVRCELLDAVSVAAFNAANTNTSTSQSSRNTTNDDDLSTPTDDTTIQRTMEEKPTLFLELSASSERTLQDHIKTTQSICVDEYNGRNFRCTSKEEDRKALWKARHELYYSSIQYREGATTAIVTDVCVPISKLAHIMEETVQDVQRYNVVGPCFGHVGDGNFHCILPIKEHDKLVVRIDTEDEDDDTANETMKERIEEQEYRKRIDRVHENLIQRALEVDGTCTGEHGVGYGKIKYLSQQYGPNTVDMMKRIKIALDPNNIMNPGKVVIV